MTDRRTWPANSRVAAEELRGMVDGVRFVHGETMRISVPVAVLCAHPQGPRDRQLLYGQAIEVFETHDDWAFGRAARDGYVGYVRASDLSRHPDTTHRVTAPATHVYAQPDIKSPDLFGLSHGSELAVIGETEAFVQTPAGFVPQQHVDRLGFQEQNLLAVARFFLGTPYLWGGNSRWGIDCSGLVQAACLACGVDCPGDSDQQAQQVGEEVEDKMRPSDLLFWDGHVALVDEAGGLLHANAHHMSVVSEPLSPALDRIAASAGPVRAHRRIKVG